MPGAADGLADTIRNLIGSEVDSNPALNQLIDDYARFHAALVVVGSVFLAATVIGSIVLWRRFARAPRREGKGWTFERSTYLAFGVLTALVSLFLAVVVAGNIGNAVNPKHGLLGAAGAIAAPADVQAAFSSWLTSGAEQMPALIQERIDDRLAWQLPKAVICTVLLVVLVVVSVLIWRSLINRSRTNPHQQRAAFWGLFVLGIVSVWACLLLMLMVMGNTQGAIAPRALTLAFG